MKLPFRVFDANGVPILIKRLVALIMVNWAHKYYYKINKLKITNLELVHRLPGENVMFVGNHQTYFMDAIALIANSVVELNPPMLRYKWLPVIGHFYYVIAVETAMMKSFLVRFVQLAGAIPVVRTWKKDDYYQDQKEKDLDSIQKDQERIGNAMKQGWMVMFPQGTTTPFAPGRKGVAEIIKKYRPIVVPWVVHGFSRAFHRNKIFGVREKNVNLHLHIKDPIEIDYDADASAILEQIMDSIEQSERFQIEYESRDTD